MKCIECHKEKSPYQFDVHLLWNWLKADQCRACTEIERYRVRKEYYYRQKALNKELESYRYKGKIKCIEPHWTEPEERLRWG